MIAYHAMLADRAVLEISGEDARDFLQGIISNDIRKVTDENVIFASLLSPQGRFLFDFFIIGHQGNLWLETAQSRIGDLKKRLLMYRLRSKVQVEEKPDYKVVAGWGNGATKPDGAWYADPRLPELGYRAMVSSSFVTPAQAGGLAKIPAFAGMTREKETIQGDYETHRLSLGVPEGEKDLIIDRSILLEYGYDELHGVDFAKGCYVGQEVTARSKHRAGLRRFIHQVSAETALPPSGTPVLVGEREIGGLRSHVGMHGLAHLKVEEVERAISTNTPLTAAGIPLRARLPAWCKTMFERAEK